MLRCQVPSTSPVLYSCPGHMQAHPAELQRAQRRRDQLHADHLLIHGGYAGTSAMRSHLRGAHTAINSVRASPTRGSH